MDMKGNKFTYKGEEEKFIKEWNDICSTLKAKDEKAKRAGTQTIIRTSSGYSRRYNNV